ncbi:non-ribosomal peptide synthetase [Fulvivirga sediminis]|uniref:Amino acid adenylation domain-containing protein n=1 Tax=Fulvivirga sediminis TaxID=2803949 RepID=A0A937F939_9BACT|nr:non-ribosomal peptide synthetase [Fulvivirga sediminis]MBL3658742.1 amino acid adenylation domain-containing protein [Fulvivirga sediminis]
MKLDKQNIEDLLEVTPFQEGLLVHYLSNPRESRQYAEQLYLKLEGETIDPELFIESWAQIQQSNEILRTVFRWEGLSKPVMAVLKKTELKLEVIDLTKTEGELEEKIATLRQSDLNKGFDLNEVPFRITLIKLKADEYRILVSNHHILYDGWSTGVLLREFFETYQSLVTGEIVNFNSKSKYKEYIQWWKKIDLSNEETFWKDYLKAFSGKSEIPFATHGKAIDRESLTRKHIFDLDDNMVEKLNTFSRQEKITGATVLYTAWSLLLAQFNDEDITIGTTVSTRPNTIKGIENTVGLYINTLPLVVKNDKTSSITSVLADVQSSLNKRAPYEMSSLTGIGEYVQGAKQGFFDSIVVIENYPLDQSLTENNSTLKITDHYMDYQTHYPLSLVISMFNNIQVTFTYNDSIFTKTALKQIEDYFIVIVDFIIEHPKKQTADIYEALHQVGSMELDSNQKDWESLSLIQKFEEQIKERSIKPAIKGDSGMISYGELDGKVGALVNMLQEKGVEAQDNVLLYFDTSAEVIVAMLACMKLNVTFLPVTSNTPDDRVKYIVANSGAKMILTDLKSLSKANYLQLDVEVLCVSLQALDSVTMASVQSNPEDIAYIIYTSGTTGQPKGVSVKNSGFKNYILGSVDNYVKGEVVSFPLFTSPAFDLTLTSIFVPLASGNSIVVYHADNSDFLIERVYEDNQCDIIKLTPSHLRLLKEKIDSKKDRNGFKSRLKRLIVGGEDFKTSLAEQIDDLFDGQIEMYNEYGPTEGTIGCMIHKYDPATDLRKSVPIGKASVNNDIYVLNDRMQPVVSGQTGDIYIGGAGVAAGYVNNEEMTANRFVLNPFSGKEDRLYKTGDLARVLTDGNLEFLGRDDKQIKLNGYRIELGEIESKLLRYGQSVEDEGTDFSISTATGKLRELHRCSSCLLPENYPGIEYDEKGICNICNEFEHYSTQIESYFRKEEDFEQVSAEMKSNSQDYDCLLLYSGGKDSTYVLYKLIDYGLKVMTYTFDNGYISKTAFKNIEQTTNKLGIKHFTISSDNMKKVFAESLRQSCSSCHGCWHAINTFGVQLANEYGIKYIVSGLSRGQIYDMRLEGIFEARVFEEDDIEKQLTIFRNQFHSKDNKYSRLLNVSVNDKLDGVQFVDFFRYYNTPISDIRSYLLSKGWVQPKDTGFCSSNCLINDIGIYTHIKERGFNFYTAPLSWDVRLGQATREECMEEITAFGSTEKHVKKVLEEIEYAKAFEIDEAIVVKEEDEDGTETLTAYIVSNIEPNVSELRTFLRRELPEYMIPSHFVQIDHIPLTSNGKVDTLALPKTSHNRPKLGSNFVQPSSAVEVKVTEICLEVLKIDEIGIYDNLFDLGAKSFDLTRIANKLSDAFATKVNVITLFEKSTVHELAKMLNNTAKKEAEKSPKTERVSPNKLRQRRALLNKK